MYLQYMRYVPTKSHRMTIRLSVTLQASLEVKGWSLEGLNPDLLYYSTLFVCTCMGNGCNRLFTRFHCTEISPHHQTIAVSAEWSRDPVSERFKPLNQKGMGLELERKKSNHNEISKDAIISIEYIVTSCLSMHKVVQD